MLGILEHASRAALCLEALQSKSSWTLILKLIEAIRRHGKPRAVRTDNEAGLRVPDVLPGTAPPRHRASANRSRLPLAEWPGRALVRHAEGEARSARGRFIRSAQRCSCRVPLLLQPRPLAPASRRPDARPFIPLRANTGSKPGMGCSAATTYEGDARTSEEKKWRTSDGKAAVRAKRVSQPH